MVKIMILSIAGIVVSVQCIFFMEKASGRYWTPITIYISTIGGGCRALIQQNFPAVFTTGGYGAQAQIKGSSPSSAGKIWGTSNCALGATPVHFHG